MKGFRVAMKGFHVIPRSGFAQGFDSGKIVKEAYSRYNVSLGVGLSEVAGKVFRIGHLGNNDEVRLRLLLPSLVMEPTILCWCLGLPHVCGFFPLLPLCGVPVELHACMQHATVAACMHVCHVQWAKEVAERQ